MITETTINDDSEASVGVTDGPGYHLLVMSPQVFFSQPLPDSGVVTIGRSSKCNTQIEDPLASREHMRLHVEAGMEGPPALAVEDVGSANGTRVRDLAIDAGLRVPLLPGDAVTIGSTVIMVLQDRSPIPPRRLWSHAYFENRVEDECARSATTKASFALVRLRFSSAALWTRVLPILARELPPPHLFAAYGPRDYEVLVIDATPEEAARLTEHVLVTCRAAGLDALSALASYPRDGRSGDALVAKANALLRSRLRAAQAPSGPSPVALAGMQRVRDMAARAASSSINVLVLGETGVGKEVLVELIHRQSPRASGPLVAINCAGLADTLVESELFGHERGAFTGAATAKVGLLEAARGGTVFLDEVGEMALPLQAKLLRAIESRLVTPVGSVRAQPIDVRFVSATNRDLERAIAAGTFRSDLMYRLNGISLMIPPLRERVDEIPLLADTFIEEACRDLERRELLRLTPEAMDHLVEYGWPGNIRELKNVIERAVLLCDGPVIGAEHLPLERMRLVPLDETAPQLRLIREESPLLADPGKLAEKRRIEAALAACASNQTRAAKLLGISRRTLVTKLSSYGIPRPQKGPAVDSK